MTAPPKSKGGRPRKPDKFVQVSIAAPRERWVVARAKAASEGISLAALIRRFLEGL